MNEYTTITEIVNDLQKYLDATQIGKQTTTRHNALKYAIEKWLINNANKHLFVVNMRGYNNTIEVLYKGWRFFFIDIKRKYINGRNYYDAFIVKPYIDNADNIAEYLANIEATTTALKQKQEREKEQSRIALKIVMQHFNCCESDARMICAGASHCYDI